MKPQKAVVQRVKLLKWPLSVIQFNCNCFHSARNGDIIDPICCNNTRVLDINVQLISRTKARLLYYLEHRGEVLSMQAVGSRNQLGCRFSFYFKVRQRTSVSGTQENIIPGCVMHAFTCTKKQRRFAQKTALKHLADN